MSCDESALVLTTGMGLLLGRTTPTTSPSDNATELAGLGTSSMQNILAWVITGVRDMVELLPGITL